MKTFVFEDALGPNVLMTHVMRDGVGSVSPTIKMIDSRGTMPQHLRNPKVAEDECELLGTLQSLISEVTYIKFSAASMSLTLTHTTYDPTNKSKGISSETQSHAALNVPHFNER